MASATAHRLFRCGFPVVMTERPHPSLVRRWVSFGTAVFEGEIEVEGVRGVSYPLEEASRLTSFSFDHIPIFTDPQCEIKTIWKPDVIIDGRILKKNCDNHLKDAPLVIGFGPGIEAGKNVHYVIETNRGHDLGRIIEQGRAAENTSIPGNIGGYTSERLLRSPGEGLFESQKAVGDTVDAGDIIGTVGDKELKAQIGGVIRGLIHPGSLVKQGQKLGDIDPRGNTSFCKTISDKARTISGSALEVILSWPNRSVH